MASGFSNTKSDIMQKDSRIYVAGHTGLVGSALLKGLESQGFRNLILRTHKELDLTNQHDVESFFNNEKPEFVILAAAKVGGILANQTFPAEFIHDNLAIERNVIHGAWKSMVKRLLFFGSSCIYPRNCPQPIREDYLLSGPLEPTNRPYALAKIAGIEMCWAYNRQYGTKFLAVMPTNLYGPGDNYDLQNAHVVPALIRKMHEAKEKRDPKVMIWGSGNPRRELLYSEDMADACLTLMELQDSRLAFLFNEMTPPLVNIGYGEDLTIRELAGLIRDIVGFKGELEFDPSKPDGSPQKWLDGSKMREWGWKPKVHLQEGLIRAYEDLKSFLKT